MSLKRQLFAASKRTLSDDILPPSAAAVMKEANESIITKEDGSASVLDETIGNVLRARKFEQEFTVPSYYDYCLSNVPGTILSIFGIKVDRMLPAERLDPIGTEDIQTVVLIVADGLGYDMWSQRRSDGGFFGRMTEKGLVFPITSVFPTTTAAALTTLYTGL